jgi:protein-disulfide isomerase-like protein with CxxC motif
MGEPVAEHLAFHFDPLCPWCWQTSRWARRLVELGAATVDWKLFSLLIQNSADGVEAVDPAAPGVRGLRTAVLVRETGGNEAIGAFYEALGMRHFHGDLESYEDEDTFRKALTDVGLDAGLYDRAMADPATWDAVVTEHRTLVDETQAFGVPTIRLDGGTGPAIFGPVVSELPTDEDAVELLTHTAWLVRYRNFGELKRERIDLDVPSAAAWRARQAAKKAAEEAKAAG